ncbi:hypothetical protein ACFQ9Q_19280 [Streptomyces virginiae]
MVVRRAGVGDQERRGHDGDQRHQDETMPIAYWSRLTGELLSVEVGF